MLIIIHNYRL